MTSRWPRILTVRALSCSLLVALPGCGGKSGHVDAGSDGGGSGAPSSAGGAGAPVVESKPFYWDDAFPWFDQAGVGDFPSRDEDRVLHLTAEGTPARAVLSTHFPTTSTTRARFLEFSARGSAVARLLVSVGHDQQTYDYFTRSPEDVWPLGSVDLTSDFRRYSVDLTELTPPEDPPASGGLSFLYMAFLLDQPEPTEVWIDQVQLE